MMEDAYEGTMGPGAISSTLASWRKRGQPSYSRYASINTVIKQSFFWQERTYVSCWNAFPHENAGLWRIYGDDKGVVVRTTWGSLRKSLLGRADCVDRVFYGRVDYRDFDTDSDFTDTYTDQYFIKRREFVHEHEFRLVAHDNSRTHTYNDTDPTDLPHYAALPCDLNLLIEEVLISPRLGSWVKEPIIAVSTKYDGKWNVRQSNLYQPPIKETYEF